jgi:MFS family permease
MQREALLPVATPPLRVPTPLLPLLILLVYVVLTSMVLGLTYSATPALLQQFFNGGVSCAGDAGKSDECLDAAARASLVVGIADGVGAVISFVGAAWLGQLSDVLGRKPFLGALAAIACLPSLSLYLYLALDVGECVWLYFALRASCGIAQTSAVWTSAVGDLVPEPDAPLRARVFAVLFGASTACLAAGPALSLALTPSQCFLAGSSSAVGAVLLTLTCVSETMPRPLHHEPLRRGPCANNPFAAMQRFARSGSFRLLAAATVFMSVPLYGVGDTFALYVLVAFGGGSASISQVLIVFGGAGLVSQLLLLPALLRCVSIQTALSLAISLSGLSYLTQAFATSLDVFTAMVAFNAVGFVAFSCITSLISSAVSQAEQGAVQGAFAAYSIVGKSFGPLLLGGVFKLFTSGAQGLPVYPQAIFLVATGFMLCAVVCSLSCVMSWPPVNMPAADTRVVTAVAGAAPGDGESGAHMYGASHGQGHVEDSNQTDPDYLDEPTNSPATVQHVQLGSSRAGMVINAVASVS